MGIITFWMYKINGVNNFVHTLSLFQEISRDNRNFLDFYSSIFVRYNFAIKCLVEFMFVNYSKCRSHFS
jgi:hypothetical protein